MAPDCIVVGNGNDPHAEAVITAVNRRNRIPLVVDAARLERQPYCLTRGSLGLADQFEALSWQTPLRGWIRRLAPPNWRGPVPGHSIEATEKDAWLELLSAILHAPNLDWLSAFVSLMRSDNKVLQYLMAEQLGIDVPEWVVTDSVDDVRIRDPLVLKPLGSGHYLDPTGRPRVVYTHAVEPPHLSGDWEGWAALAGAPFIVQRRIDVKLHLRVVTVKDEAWVCILEATNSDDWRRDAAAHRSFQPAHHGDWIEVKRLALDIAAAFRLRFSSQDWLVDGSAFWFIDLNPAGQWLFLPPPVSSSVTAGIADWLCSR